MSASLMIELVEGNLSKTLLNSENKESRVVSPPLKTASLSRFFEL